MSAPWIHHPVCGLTSVLPPKMCRRCRDKERQYEAQLFGEWMIETLNGSRAVGLEVVAIESLPPQHTFEVNTFDSDGSEATFTVTITQKVKS